MPQPFPRRHSGGSLDYNQDEAISRLCGWSRQAQHCTLFDFATKGIVQVRCSSGVNTAK